MTFPGWDKVSLTPQGMAFCNGNLLVQWTGRHWAIWFPGAETQITNMDFPSASKAIKFAEKYFSAQR